LKRNSSWEGEKKEGPLPGEREGKRTYHAQSGKKGKTGVLRGEKKGKIGKP